MGRYVKRTVSENFDPKRPAMVPGLGHAVRDAETRAAAARLDREELLWDRVGDDR